MRLKKPSELLSSSPTSKYLSISWVSANYNPLILPLFTLSLRTPVFMCLQAQLIFQGIRFHSFIQQIFVSCLYMLDTLLDAWVVSVSKINKGFVLIKPTHISLHLISIPSPCSPFITQLRQKKGKQCDHGGKDYNVTPQAKKCHLPPEPGKGKEQILL